MIEWITLLLDSRVFMRANGIPAGLRYFDTPESLRQKLAYAAAHGCRCAIGLWQAPETGAVKETM